MKNKRLALMISILGITIVTLGISYAFLSLTLNGQENSVLVTGDIYMNYTETNQISLTDAVPMSKDAALQLKTNSFNFQIKGKNQSKKDMYYGISIVYGEEQASKTRLKDEDIDVYLLQDTQVLVDAARYKTLNDTRIWADKIAANTNQEVTRNYTLRMWVDENVVISDTDANKDYTLDTWNKSYASFKVKVDGNLDKMNVPLEIDAKDSYYENGKAYFNITISNYLNPDVAGISLAAADTMKLDITSTNKDVEFGYYVSDEDKSGDETLGSISKTYSFDTNTTKSMQVFVTSKSNSDIKADINVKLTKNSDTTYEMVKNMHIRGAKDYCKNNGFSKFSDCLLVSEQLSNDVESAKKAIEDKGAATLSKTAPVVTYTEGELKTGATVPQSSGYLWTYGDSVTFNTSTGIYTITGNVQNNQSLSSAMNNKWTCGTTNYGTTTCGTVYKITSMEGNTIKTASSKTYVTGNAIGSSEVGLYKTTDNDGDTFFYRGAVENNNVYFAGFYWKVIRVNGDGSVRLIYNGTKPNSTDYDASSVTGAGAQYNSRYADPTYVGYMYGENFSETPVTSKETNYTDIQATTKYWFGKGYTPDASAKTFKLTTADYQGTFTEYNTAGKLAAGYTYTCKSTSATGTCQFLIEVVKFNSATSIQAKYITYGSTSYANTRLDTASSNAKTVLENWYTGTLAKKTEAGQSATSYINADSTFCNDRTLSTQGGNGDGFSTAPATYYGAYDRNVNKKAASLVCPEAADLFSATEAKKGNKKLAQPIGLITADEVALAGGLYNTKNEKYYLRTGQYYWTMSPSLFHSWFASANMFRVLPSGEFVNLWVAGSNGVRAVINLKSDVLLAGGNGTSADPYTLKLS